MAKKIPLTQGQFAIVDDHWYDYLTQWKWYAVWAPTTQSFYAARCELNPKKTIRMSRVIMNTPDGMECDHRHHDTLDNRESELRNVTHAQNQMNKRTRKKNTTGVTGVCIRLENGKYIAQLYFQSKRVLYKSFHTLEEATKARKEAEGRYFGDFSYKESK